MKKTINWEIKSSFRHAEEISGLELKKVHTFKAGKLTVARPIFAVFGRPAPALPRPDLSQDTTGLAALSFLVDHLDELLTEDSRPIDLSDEARYQMKVAAAEAMGLHDENATDHIRLIEEPTRVIIYILDFVKDFRKTESGGYTWKWNF